MQLVEAADDELFSNLSPEELKLVTWIETSEIHGASWGCGAA